MTSFLPSILTRLSQFALTAMKNPQDSQAMRSAKTTSLIAALHLTLAGAIFYAFNKAQKADEKNLNLGIPKEKLAACGFLLLCPPAVGLASQAQTMQAGYRCIKTGLATGNRKKVLAGAFALLATYATTTVDFSEHGGAVQRGISRLTTH